MNFWQGVLQGYQTAYNANPTPANLLTFQTEVANFILLVIEGAQNTAAGQDITTMIDKETVASYFTNELTANGIVYTPGVANPSAEQIAINKEAHLVVMETDTTGHPVLEVEAEIQAFIALLHTTNETFTLTVGQDTFTTGTGNDTYNAPLAGVFGNQNTLTNLDKIVDSGPNNVLTAGFEGSFSAANGVTIQGVQTWNIENIGTHGVVTIAGAISGLTSLTYNDNFGNNSLEIGTNLSPIQLPTGVPASGFNLTVENALGSAKNHAEVDLKFATTALSGTDTINVTANVVGNSKDNDLDDAFGIAAGAPAHGAVAAVGFATWNVLSEGVGVSSVNDIALGGDGSKTATTLNVTDDGSTTIIYATKGSDSGGAADWADLKVINAAALDGNLGTTGQLTITGGETTADSNGAGLLADNHTALTSVTGGTGADVFDLSASTWSKTTTVAIDNVSINGGANTTGQNSLFDANAVAGSDSGIGTVVELSQTEVTTISDAYAGTTGAFAEWMGVTNLLIVTNDTKDAIAINMDDFPGTNIVTLANGHSGNWVPEVGNIAITNAADGFTFNFQDVQAAGNFSIVGIGGSGSTATINYGTGYLDTDPVGTTGAGAQTFVSTGIDNVDANLFGASGLTASENTVYAGGIVAVGVNGGTGETLTVDSNVGLALAYDGHSILSDTTLALFGGVETTTVTPPFITTWSETGTLDLKGTAEYWLGVTNASTIDDSVKTAPLNMEAPGDAIDYGQSGVTVTADGADSILQGNLDIHGIISVDVGNDTLTDTAGGVTFYGNGDADTITMGDGVTNANDVVFGEFDLNGTALRLDVETFGVTTPGFWGAPSGTFGNQGTSTSVDLTTITGFTVGSDNLTFNVSAWVGVHLVDGASALANHAITDANASGSTVFLGTAGLTLGVGSAATTTGHVDLILDGINAQNFANAAALAASIGTTGVGNFILGHAPTGGGVDLLVAYNTGTAVNIADVHISGTSTNTGADTVTASDMVSLVGVTSLASLGTTANATHIVFDHV